MPSVILGNPLASGAQLIVSGNPWSGHFQNMGLQLRWVSSGGNAYVALSGGNPPLSGGFMTITSGAMLLSGGANSGLLDGVLMAPGEKYFIPPAVLGNQGGLTSGVFNVFALCDVGASGVGRMYFEPWNGFKN